MNEKTTLPGETSNAQAMTVRQGDALGNLDAAWADLPGLTPASQSSTQNFTVYLHSLRRHWVKATVSGLIVAALVAPIVWFWAWPAQYKGSAYLRVATKEHSVAFESSTSSHLAITTFDIYKNTQLQYIQGPLVLQSALRESELAKYKLDDREKDPLVWLQENLKMGFPGNAELMEISLTCYDKQEAADVVNAVVDAYLTEVVGVEQGERRKRLDELQRVFAQKRSAVEEKRSNLKRYAEQVGTSDVANVTLKQRIRVEDLASLRRQLMQVQSERRLIKAELGAQNALLTNVDAAEVSLFELDRLLQNNVEISRMGADLAMRRMQVADVRSRLRAGADSRQIQQHEIGLAQAQAELDTHKEALKEGVREMKRSEINAEIKQITAKIDVLDAQELELEELVAAKAREVEQLSGSSVDIEMMRAEIDYLSQNLTSIGLEKDQLNVELLSAPRITLVQAAAPPKTELNKPLRVAVLVVLMGLGFCIPAIGIVVWDSRARRINSCEEVSKGLGLNVIGSVPLIPSRVLRGTNSASKQSRNWQMRLTESVDAIAARLLRQATTDQQRVVLITSALGGEGKTTLATQLAMSLARSGRNTLLVDFDLRRPAFDEVFALPPEPGVSEVLRRQADLSQSVHRTDTDNLSVLTAGSWDRNALAALANGGAEPIFEELRSEYEFVIVDASPILPVADTRFVSQYMDAVILSVFRDVSRAPKVQAAREVLEAFGVSTVETVVAGSSEYMEAKDMEYAAALPAPE